MWIAATAQHNLTISMASNEALSKALDQLSETYVSHELTDGNEMTAGHSYHTRRRCQYLRLCIIRRLCQRIGITYFD